MNPNQPNGPIKIQSLDRSAFAQPPAPEAAVSAADAPAAVAVPDEEPVLSVVPEPDLAPAQVGASAEELELLSARPHEKKMLGAQFAAASLAIVVHAALLLLLGVLIVVVPSPPVAEISAVVSAEQTQEKPETKQIVAPQPTMATTAIARSSTSAIAAVGVSPIALPRFDFKAPADAVTEIATTDLGSTFATAFQPKGTATVNFFGIKAKGRRIAFLIEAERYMLTDPKGGIPAYQIVKEEIASMIAKFGVSTAFNVLMFDHFHLSAFNKDLLPATSANIERVRDWLYPVNREFEKIGLAAINYPPLQARTEVEPIKSKLLQGYMLAIQYALESDVDTVFIITSGWRWMNALESEEERIKFLKDQRWGEREEKAWQAAIKQAQAWLAKENAARVAKGIPQRVVRSLDEIITELRIPVRHKPGVNIDAETRQEQVINAIRVIYSGQGKPKPQINFVLFVGKDEEVIPMQEHFEDIAQRARGGKMRVLQGLAALKNVTGR